MGTGSVRNRDETTRRRTFTAGRKGTGADGSAGHALEQVDEELDGPKGQIGEAEGAAQRDDEACDVDHREPRFPCVSSAAMVMIDNSLPRFQTFFHVNQQVSVPVSPS